MLVQSLQVSLTVVRFYKNPSFGFCTIFRKTDHCVPYWQRLNKSFLEHTSLVKDMVIPIAASDNEYRFFSNLSFTLLLIKAKFYFHLNGLDQLLVGVVFMQKESIRKILASVLPKHKLKQKSFIILIPVHPVSEICRIYWN